MDKRQDLKKICKELIYMIDRKGLKWLDKGQIRIEELGLKLSSAVLQKNRNRIGLK